MRAGTWTALFILISPVPGLRWALSKHLRNKWVSGEAAEISRLTQQKWEQNRVCLPLCSFVFINKEPPADQDRHFEELVSSNAGRGGRRRQALPHLPPDKTHRRAQGISAAAFSGSFKKIHSTNICWMPAMGRSPSRKHWICFYP